MDETDVDSYFYHNNSDNSHIQRPRLRNSKGSKKNLAFKLFLFWGKNKQQRYIPQQKEEISKKELNFLVDKLCDFLKAFDQASKCIQFSLPKSKVEIGYTKAKDNLFTQKYEDINEPLLWQYRSPCRFGNNKPCIFSIKKFERPGNQYTHTENANLNYREIHHLYKHRYYLANKCEIF